MNSTRWFKDAIIYQILIDRFTCNKRDDWSKPIFLGGAIKGIIEKLPYLQELGVNTLWISPFYKTNVYHGYNIIDFFEVEQHFGTKEDLIQLIKEVHKRNMKIIADFVPNHCSRRHPYFLEAQKNKEIEYHKWFYFKRWPDKYLCFLSVRDLPKINLEDEPARDHMIKAAKYWLELGLDGYRLDHAIGPSHRFWKVFRREIKKDFPHAILIGEVWMRGIKFKELKTVGVRHKYLKWFYGASSDSLFREYIGELDGVLDFQFQSLIKRFVEGKIDEKLLKRKLKKHYAKYPDTFYLPTFLDNHDMDRFLFVCGNDKEKLKKAAEIQFSIKQPVIIYYGTEVGMSQEKSVFDVAAHGDLQVRQPMKWEEQDKGLLEFYKSIIRERKMK